MAIKSTAQWGFVHLLLLLLCFCLFVSMPGLGAGKEAVLLSRPGRWVW